MGRLQAIALVLTASLAVPFSAIAGETPHNKATRAITTDAPNKSYVAIVSGEVRFDKPAFSGTLVIRGVRPTSPSSINEDVDGFLDSRAIRTDLDDFGGPFGWKGKPQVSQAEEAPKGIAKASAAGAGRSYKWSPDIGAKL